MKHIFLLLLTAAVCVLSGCGKAPEKKLVVVTNAAFPPYEYVANRKIEGIDPHIIREIASRLGYTIEIQDMSFDSVIAAVQSGKADIAASGITVTEERKKQVAFSLPYVVAEQVIIVPQTSKIAAGRDLKGKRVGVQHGTTGDMYVSKHIGEPQRYKDSAVAVAALLSGKLDAIVIDTEPAEVYVKQRPSLKRLSEPLTFEEYAFAFNRNNRELLDGFNAELEKMLKSGEVAQIIKMYKEAHSQSAGNVVVDANGFWNRMKQSFALNFLTAQRYYYLLDGFFITLQVTVFAIAIGLVIGFAVAVIRNMSEQTGRLKWLDWLCRLYLTVIRGTPVVVQLLIIYFVIFSSVDIDKVFVAIIAFGINSGAYVAEIVRGGIASIDKGQMEAARSLGFGYWQSMRFVILPQAVKSVLPSLGNEFIVLLKETSVSGYIALQDLTKGGDIIRSQTYDAFFPLLAVALVYLIVVMVLGKLLAVFEKRLKRNE
ncbi:MAG: transporter substrate-binding domain-containing protein [Lentisphaerae bacterium]|nr:transporter substrate-binding domain-containing protein [Lentisphaerota bacterium]